MAWTACDTACPGLMCQGVCILVGAGKVTGSRLGTQSRRARRNVTSHHVTLSASLAQVRAQCPGQSQFQLTSTVQTLHANTEQRFQYPQTRVPQTGKSARTRTLTHADIFIQYHDQLCDPSGCGGPKSFPWLCRAEKALSRYTLYKTQPLRSAKDRWIYSTKDFLHRSGSG